MTALAPIAPVAAARPPPPPAPPIAARPLGVSFAQMLTSGVEGVSQKITDADAMVRAFALNDAVPLHQVTFALEEAKDAFDLMMQVRSRLIDAYQEFSRMQL